MAVSFAFFPKETFNYTDSDIDRLEAAAYLSLADHTVDLLAECTSPVRKAQRHSLIRVFIFEEACIAASCVMEAGFQTEKIGNFFIAKNNIPLKLQI